MEIEQMQTPSSRAEFERRLSILKERVITGKFCVPSGDLIDGLKRVRILPNGRVDLLSIDEMTRLQANMMVQVPLHLIEETGNNQSGHSSQES